MRRTALLSTLAFPLLLAAGAPLRAESEPGAWIGRWVSGDAAIEIAAAPQAGLLAASGRTCVACGEPGERVGRFEILGRPSGDLMLLVETESGAFTPEAPTSEDATCLLALKRTGEGLEVLDNGGCGGASVSFDGRYASAGG